MGIVFANNAVTTLAAPLLSSQTTLHVFTGTGDLFPSPGVGEYFKLTIEDRRTQQIEIVHCIGRSGDVLTIERGKEDFSALNFLLGATVSNRFTRDTAEAINDLIPNPNPWYLGPYASNPTTDNDGNPLQAGHQYFNLSDTTLYMYTGASWVPYPTASPVTSQSGTYVLQDVSGDFDGSETEFDLRYTDYGAVTQTPDVMIAEQFIVFLNGVRQRPGTDYTIPVLGTIEFAAAPLATDTFDGIWVAVTSGLGAGDMMRNGSTSMTGNLPMGGNRITNMANGIAPSDGATVAQISALSSVYQPLDGDLTSIAGLSTQTFGRSLLTLASAAVLTTLLIFASQAEAEAGSLTDVVMSPLRTQQAKYTATLGSENLTLQNWLKGYGKATRPIGTTFYDAGATISTVHRFNDRLFIGGPTGGATAKLGAAAMHTDRGAASSTNETIFSNDGDTPGANWMARDSMILAIHPKAGLAICGAVRVSDGTGTDAPIGVASAVINNVAGKQAWTFYADIQHENVANAFTAGMEVAAKNKGPSYTSTAYSRTNGIHGIWLAGGGDNAYGGSATAPANTAIYVLRNDDFGWNRGLIFGSTSLDGTDGSDSDSGSGVAVEMARQHLIRWLKPNGNEGAKIRSTIQNAGTGWIQTFDNTTLRFLGQDGALAFRVSLASAAVNYVDVVGGATGVTAQVRVVSATDTNCNLTLAGQGTGGVIATFTNTGLGILDTNASHRLNIICGSDLTSNRTLTLTFGNADKILDLSGATYTPTLTNVTNIDASTAFAMNYERFGNRVHVWGIVQIDATTTATSSEIGMSLPIASNFTGLQQCIGFIISSTAGTAGRVIADTTNDRAQVQFTPTPVTNITYTIDFWYDII